MTTREWRGFCYNILFLLTSLKKGTLKIVSWFSKQKCFASAIHTRVLLVYLKMRWWKSIVVACMLVRSFRTVKSSSWITLPVRPYIFWICSLLSSSYFLLLCCSLLYLVVPDLNIKWNNNKKNFNELWVHRALVSTQTDFALNACWWLSWEYSIIPFLFVLWVMARHVLWCDCCYWCNDTHAGRETRKKRQWQ